jgi:hypothetical protein
MQQDRNVMIIQDPYIDILKVTRAKIFGELKEVERRLAGTLKTSSYRAELLERKELLLLNLREENLRIKKAKQDIRAARRESPVTDHALVRWLERKHGLDTDRLRDAILTDALRQALDANRWHDDGELTYVISDRVVVTVVPTPKAPEGAV